MKSFSEYLNESELLVEMARLNVDEVDGSMPFDRYDVRMWSNDHEPAHIHVSAPNRKNPEFEAEFDIDSGSLLDVKFCKKSNMSFTNIEKIVREWLDEKNAIDQSKTNRQVCEIEWRRHNA